LLPKSLITENPKHNQHGDGDEDNVFLNLHKLIWLLHTRLDVEDYPITFKVEDSDPEEERHVCNV